MPEKPQNIKNLKFFPVTPSRWNDFEKLFGRRGACGGCWCMWWRLAKKDYEKNKGKGNKSSMKRMILSGKAPGIIAYVKGEPVGWCSVAPRNDYARLLTSRILAPVDNKDVWSVMCLFINKEFRKKGLSSQILRAACLWASKNGAKIVEGYPQDLKNKLPDPFVYTGLESSYRRAGFKEILRRSKTRPIMRYYVGK